MTQGKKNSKSTSVVKRDPSQTTAKRVNKIQALSTFLEGRRDEIVKILPPQLSVERVIKTAIMAAMENPDIGEKCSAISIYRSVIQASLMGLTVGSGFNEGYFIRYGDACTFRASYLGWSKVAQRSEGVDVIRASVVYAGDEFEMSEQPPTLLHRPARVSNRGEVEGAVAAAYTLKDLKDGKTAHMLYDFTFVDAEELAQAKKMADKFKESPSWRAWPNEMRKKVAIRRLCKMLPRNEALDRLARIENSADNGVVDVPDPDIPSDMNQMVVDARFDDMEDTPDQATSSAPQQMPESEVVQAPKRRQSRTDQLKGQIAKGKPSSSPGSNGKAKEKQQTPPPPDNPDYGGPAASQQDLEF